MEHYDVLGILPEPLPQEEQTYIAKKMIGHREDVVSQLLSSPHYAKKYATLLVENNYRNEQLRKIMPEPYTQCFRSFDERAKTTVNLIARSVDALLESNDLTPDIRFARTFRVLSPSIFLYEVEEPLNPDIHPNTDWKERIEKSYEEFCREKEKLVETNQRFVAQLAHKYARSGKKAGVDITDLYQEGLIGLDKSIKLFQLTKNAKIITYAGWWSRQHITRYIDNNRGAARLPIHIQHKLRLYLDIRENLTQKGDSPSDQIIREEMGLGEKEFRKLKAALQQSTPLSLDAPIGYDKDGEAFHNFIASDDDGFAKMELSDIGTITNNLIDEMDLTEKEKAVVELRLGLVNDNKPKTLEEIGEQFGVTRERIRQIQNKALKKMRHPARIKKIIELFPEYKRFAAGLGITLDE